MIDFDMKFTNSFYGIEENLDKIIDLFNEYNFYDVMIAVYCINLYIKNRSVLLTQMRLNLGLTLCKKTGNKRINSYKEFCSFFKKIKLYTNTCIYDDPILEDFGEIKYKYNSKTYCTIIGTGYNAVYAQLFFLEPLAHITDKSSIIEKVIKFNSDSIEYFRDINISDGIEKTKFIRPPCKLFTRVKKYFKEMEFIENEELSEIVEMDNNYIEDKYFLLFDNKYYPLYNTAILINLFNKLYSGLNDDEKNSVVENGIYSTLNDLSIIDQGEFPVLYYPIKQRSQMSDLSVNPYTFLGLARGGNSIIAINKSRYNSDEELNNEIGSLKKRLFQNKLELVELRKRSTKGLLGLSITSKSNLKFILYDNYVNLYEPNNILGGKRKHNILECNALDLIYLLTFADGLDEIVEYIDYNDQNEYDQLIGFGGDSSRFFTWKSMNHMIAKGAIKFGMLNMDINTTDGFVLDFYKNKINDFPWNCSDKYFFANPLAWVIEKRKNDIYFYRNKIIPTFAGIVKYLRNNQLCFFAQNLLFWDKNNIKQLDNITALLDDLIMRKIVTCFDYFNILSDISKKSLYFIFLPFEYAKKVGFDLSDNMRLVYSECIEDENLLNFRYTINYDLLCLRIKESSNRIAENDFIRELLEPCNKYYPNEINIMNDFLNKTNIEKKEVDVFQIKIDYVYNSSYKKYNVNDYNYLKVKKKIAEICLGNNISPGEYYGKEATNLIRKMQKELITQFEENISNYNQLDLHIKLLEMYSNSTHEIYVHRKRYNLINNVTDDILNEVRLNIIEQREEAKQNSRTLLYLIESNLYLNRNKRRIISDDKFQYLLAFSHWLVNLNDIADICYFTENEAHIEVNFEYVVDNIGDNIEYESDSYIKRVYSKNGYSIKYDDEDILYFKKVKETFESETNCNLSGIADICCYLQTEFLSFDYKQLDQNVYKVSKESLINNLSYLVESKTHDKYSVENIEKNLDLLLINPEQLKNWKGKKDYFLPFNEREKRDNRFEIKPIIKVDDSIIFSPVLMKNVSDIWFEGIINFMLPYEIGIPKTRNVILEWKKIYEDKMVYDIRDIFLKNNITFVKTNQEIHKIDKNENYPNDIGDFDVIAIDNIKKNIWIIESKFLNKVGNFYEMFDQQRNFFKENKYIEMFQRRIDFMNDKRVLKSFGFIDVNGFKVLSYMVFNKVMISRYRKIKISLISICELDDIIKESD